VRGQEGGAKEMVYRGFGNVEDDVCFCFLSYDYSIEGSNRMSVRDLNQPGRSGDSTLDGVNT
jgi:hypothetical protein